MKNTIFFLLCTISVSGLPPKHIYIPSSMSWTQAQANCRQLYGDLSTITSAEEEAQFIADAAVSTAWIGIYKDLNLKVWKWSGAGLANYTNFQPDYLQYSTIYEDIYKYGVWTKSGWMALNDRHSYPSFCFSLIVIEQKMSWEDALMYCRSQHTELTSLLSEYETQLARRKMMSDQISEKAWIGLRFLENKWIWMSGEPLNYTQWAHRADFTVGRCPVNRRCGALNKRGHWENWDCNDKLNFICS